MNHDFISTDVLWRSGLAAIPLAIVVALACRCLPCRPSTRHALWLIVLLSLVIVPMLPRIDLISDVIPTRSASRDGSSTQRTTDARGAEHSAARHVSVVPIAPECLAIEHLPSVGDLSSVYDDSIDSLEFATPTSRGGDVVPTALAPPRVFSADSTSPAIAVIETLPAAAALPGCAATPTITGSFLNEWFNRLLNVRDALLALAPISSGVWLTGATLVALALMIRIARFRMVIAGATEAPRSDDATSADSPGVHGPPPHFAPDLVWPATLAHLAAGLVERP
jgi:beta-lactamase regulating signal transducer with metallopeptidase domain